VTSHASGLRATNGHNRFYANPRLQARVLVARSEMVTTRIAQIVRLARPNIQIYDARVVDLYQWVCAPYRVVARRPGSFPVGDRIHAATSLQVVVTISKLGSQFSLQHFARRISREVRHEHKSTRNFVPAKLLPAERDKIVQRRC